MTSPFLAAATLIVLALPAFAEGDVAKGETAFKKCKSCHSIVAPDGTAIQKGGKVGPNLFGVVGRTIGSYSDFKHGDSIVSVGAAGQVWDEAALALYVADPAAWLEQATGDAGAKTKMTFKLPKGGEDLAAYLASLN